MGAADDKERILPAVLFAPFGAPVVVWLTDRLLVHYANDARIPWLDRLLDSNRPRCPLILWYFFGTPLALVVTLILGMPVALTLVHYRCLTPLTLVASGGLVGLFAVSVSSGFDFGYWHFVGLTWGLADASLAWIIFRRRKPML